MVEKIIEVLRAEFTGLVAEHGAFAYAPLRGVLGDPYAHFPGLLELQPVPYHTVEYVRLHLLAVGNILVARGEAVTVAEKIEIMYLLPVYDAEGAFIQPKA